MHALPEPPLPCARLNAAPLRRHLTGIFTSRTFNALALPVAMLTCLALAECLIETYIPRMGVSNMGIPFRITEAPLSIASFALSLLLVFRTDSTYSRWLEAVNTWTSVRVVSLELCRYGLHWMGDKQLQLVLARWTIAFSRALKVGGRVPRVARARQPGPLHSPATGRQAHPPHGPCRLAAAEGRAPLRPGPGPAPSTASLPSPPSIPLPSPRPLTSSPLTPTPPHPRTPRAQVHVREDADIADELRGVLLPHEVDAVCAADSYLHFILQALSSIVEAAHLTNLREERLFQNLLQFNEEIGGQPALRRARKPLVPWRMPAPRGPAQRTVHSARCTAHGAQRTVHSARCTAPPRPLRSSAAPPTPRPAPLQACATSCSATPSRWPTRATPRASS
jgi:hypothetical protein